MKPKMKLIYNCNELVIVNVTFLKSLQNYIVYNYRPNFSNIFFQLFYHVKK